MTDATRSPTSFTGFAIRRRARKPGHRIAAAAAIVAASLFACFDVLAQAGASVAGAKRVEADYLVGPLDTLEIFVRGEADLTTSVAVRPDGFFSIPLANDVRAAGRSPGEIALDLQERFRVYLHDPIVTVAVSDALGNTDQQIRVIGTASAPFNEQIGAEAVLSRSVGSPKGMPYNTGMTLVDVIEEVGGLSIYADGNGAYIVRRKGDGRTRVPVRLDDLVNDGDPTANVAMMPGDVLVIPQGALSGDWELTPTLGTALTFTDNIALVPGSLKEPGAIATVSPGIIFRASTPRFAASLDAKVKLQYKEVIGENNLGVNEGFDAFLDLIGASTTEISTNVFYVDINAFVTQQAQNSNQSTSVSQFVDTNQDTVGSIYVRPYLLHRFGDYVTGRLAYNFSAFFNNEKSTSIVDAFNNQELSSLTNELSYNLSSGTEFQKFRWNFFTRAQVETRTDAPDIKRANVTLSGSYPINRSFDATASIGYDWYDDGTNGNRFNGVSWSIGGNYHPSPRFVFGASIGVENNQRNIAVALDYTISPRTSFSLSYDEGVTTSEAQFSQSVGDFELDADGNIIGTNPNNQDLNFNQQTQILRTFAANFTTRHGVNVFAFDARATLSTTEPQGTDDNTYVVGGSWIRSIDTRTTGTFSVDYTMRGEGFGDDNTVAVRARIDRNVYRKVDAFVSYGFQNRDSTVRLVNFTENVVSVGLNARF